MNIKALQSNPADPWVTKVGGRQNIQSTDRWKRDIKGQFSVTTALVYFLTLEFIQILYTSISAAAYL